MRNFLHISTDGDVVLAVQMGCDGPCDGVALTLTTANGSHARWLLPTLPDAMRAMQQQWQEEYALEEFGVDVAACYQHLLASGTVREVGFGL